MKVLLSTDTVGGVWRYTVDLARALAPHADIVIATLGVPPTPAQRGELRGVPVVALDQPLDWLAQDPHALAQAGRVLADVAASEQCDVRLVHAPALVQPGLPAVSVLHSDVRTWWDAVHGGGPLPPELAWRAAATWAGCAASDAVIAVSAPYAAMVRRHCGVRLRVVPNGLAPRDPPSASRARAVLAAGRLWDPAKGARTLDAAAARMRHAVTMAGALDGPGHAFAPSHARHRGVLTPDDLRAAMDNTAVYASAALYEPFGLGVAEAAQSGMALVLSDIPAHRALWDGAALFVRPGDAAAFAAALDALLDDAAETARLAAAAASAAARYPIAATATATLHLLRMAARAYA